MLIYSQSDLAYADFRIFDDSGVALSADMDASFQWEFYDSGNNLRFTATTSSSPIIESGSDTLGTYYFVRNIDVSAWDLGIARVEISANVSSESISPSPYVENVFQIISDSAANSPFYTTLTRVKAELPGSVPTTLTDAQITTFIGDASRAIDARLMNYAVPFNAIGDDPPTPHVIEKAARLITAHECLLFLGEIRGDATVGHEWKDEADRILNELNPTDGSAPIASLPPGEYDYSGTPGREVRRTTEVGRAHSFYSSDILRGDSANSTDEY